MYMDNIPSDRKSTFETENKYIIFIYLQSESKTTKLEMNGVITIDIFKLCIR